MKVLLILEDPTHDAHVTKPIVEGLLDDVGIKARVSVLRDPHLRGASQALDPKILREVIRENPMEDAFVLVVDRDCNRQSHEEKARAREADHPGKLITCLAEQEVEVWLLALHKEQVQASWSEVRRECDPKERWAEPLLANIGVDGPGGGRKKAMRALKGNLRSLLSLCPELESLQRRLRDGRSEGTAGSIPPNRRTPTSPTCSSAPA